MKKEGMSAIILAAGSGRRMGTDIKKQYLMLQGKEILAHTVEIFENMSEVKEIILVLAKEDKTYVDEKICQKYKYQKIKAVVTGGKERQDSVWAGLSKVSEDIDYVAVHDAARPFITQEKIRECLKQTYRIGASVLAVPVKDTIKRVDTNKGVVISTPERSTLWAVQTPQIFDKTLLLQAYIAGRQHNLQVTDDSMLVEALGKSVGITEGEYTNIKITTPDDLVVGEHFLKNKIKKGVDV